MASLGVNRQVELAIAMFAGGIVGLHPHALGIGARRRELRSVRPRAPAQRHSDLAGRGGGIKGPTDGGIEHAVAHVAGEVDLVDADADLLTPRNIAATNEASIALDDRPERPNTAIFHPELFVVNWRRRGSCGGGERCLV